MVTTLRRALYLIGRDQRVRFAMLVLVALAASGFEILGAVFVYLLIALVADPGGEIQVPIFGDLRTLAEGVPERTFLLGTVAVMGAFFLLRGGVQVATVYVQKRVSDNAGARLSAKLVRGYLSWPYSVHLQRSSAELIRNGHQAVQEVVRQVFVPVIQVTAESFLALGMLALLIAIAPAAAGLAVLVVAISTTILLLVVQPRLKKLGATAHRIQAEALSHVQESLHGIRDIKVLGREDFFANRYGRSRFRLARTQYLKSTLTALPHTIIELSLIGFILLFFGITIGADDGAQRSLSVLGLFAYAGLRLQPSLQRIISGLNEIRYSSAPLEDLHADLKTAEEHSLPMTGVERVPFENSIFLEGVCFRYENAEVDALTGIDLEIHRGEQIGICGPTGGGKTTLVDIVTGLLHPTSGRVLIDGQDLRGQERGWQRNLGVVPQMMFLIDDTLRHNIALGVATADIDESSIDEAVELSQLTDFVESLPKGLDTKVGERGVRISGGQRQRITIARALYRHPTVLVFDEGTSALDTVTESQLMAQIALLRRDHTVILIAHRLTTVRNSDSIVFIDQGRIIGQGTYQELVRTSDAFRTMAESS